MQKGNRVSHLSYKSKDSCSRSLRGTVRWIGTLQGQTWLGIEWDEPLTSIATSDGFQNGVKVFQCKENHGTFINYTEIKKKLSLSFLVLGCDFRSALNERYRGTTTEILNVDYHISKNINVQFVGMDRAITHFYNYERLRCISVCDSLINSSGCLEAFKLPHLESLYLERNLLSDWGEVFEILKITPNLDLLSVSGNRFCRVSKTILHKNLKTLFLIRTNITSDDLMTVDRCFPNLQVLNLSCNPVVQGPKGSFTNLSTLVLNYANIDNWADVDAWIDYPSLTTLHLSNNSLGSISREIPNAYKIKDLYLDHNKICSWKELFSIWINFPNLQRLRITNNVLLELKGTKKEQQQQYAMITSIVTSLWLNLNNFNGSEIYAKDRIMSEKHFLSLYEREEPTLNWIWKQQKLLNHIHTLKMKNGDICSISNSSFNGLIADELIQLCVKTELNTLYRNIPGCMKIKDLRCLIRSLTDIDIKSMMCYDENNDKYDLDDDNANIMSYQINNQIQLFVN